MGEFDKKAKNFFILGKISEKLQMYSESASNYFKSLSAINDFMLDKINLKTGDHTQRFNFLKNNYPDLYKITDKLFTIYRRTYTQELDAQETLSLRNKIEEAFKYAGIDIPKDEEIEKRAKDVFKK